MMRPLFGKMMDLVLGILILISLAPMTFGASEMIVAGQYEVFRAAPRMMTNPRS
jgi:hypothetical protein